MKNKIIAGLIIITGMLFTGAVVFKSYLTDTDSKLYALGMITGLSAVMTKLLIKE